MFIQVSKKLQQTEGDLERAEERQRLELQSRKAAEQYRAATDKAQRASEAAKRKKEEERRAQQ